jgi:hypothetical protein
MTPTSPPPRDLIRYDLLVQEALKGVVRKVLIDAGKEGLPGEHHFYISFRTDFAGVRLSQRMREKYPEEMTIVLQHQFWDLGITEHAFEVGLSFSGVPERLLIPFDAIVGFFDPSVQFGLKFELNGETAETPETAAKPTKPAIRSVPSNQGSDAAENTPPASRAAAPKSAPPALPAPVRGAGSEPAEIGPSAGRAGAGKSGASKPGATKPAADGDAPAPEPQEAARVVSLDAFRKKT